MSVPAAFLQALAGKPSALSRKRSHRGDDVSSGVHTGDTFRPCRTAWCEEHVEAHVSGKTGRRGDRRDSDAPPVCVCEVNALRLRRNRPNPEVGTRPSWVAEVAHAAIPVAEVELVACRCRRSSDFEGDAPRAGLAVLRQQRPWDPVEHSGCDLEVALGGNRRCCGAGDQGGEKNRSAHAEDNTPSPRDRSFSPVFRNDAGAGAAALVPGGQPRHVDSEEN